MELGLGTNWLNNGPRSIVNDNLPNQGLPEDFVGRLIKRRYGNALTVFFIGRRDQVYFKLFAAADKGGPSYHLDDLQALDPTNEELEAASRWAMLQDPSPEFAQTVVAMLNAIGYRHIAERF